MKTEQNTGLGVWLMIVATFVFALQDGLSRYLAAEYNVLMVVMIRFWFFAAFVMALAMSAQVLVGVSLIRLACGFPLRLRGWRSCGWKPRARWKRR